MSVERWYSNSDREPRCSEKNLSQCHFVHHRFYMDWPGIEPRTLHLEAGD